MAHHVPEQFAAALRDNEGKHEEAPKDKETALRREFLNDPPDTERQGKGDGRHRYRAEKIHNKEQPVRFVKREKPRNPRKSGIAW
jgi:hypothetical protein